ncbi:uncharacterized protein [Typha latifolia]|uniref:uncharacterized protein isoform X1 n=1 Tax=Typha latifolia TaxID=4733 RepID=UPI003C2D99F0
MEIEEGGRRPATGGRFDASEEVSARPPERVDGIPRGDSFLALELLKEHGLKIKITEKLVVLMPNLLSFLKHDDPAVIRQSVASGAILFGAVLQEMALQLNRSGKVDGWLEEIWSWMVQFKDSVCGIVLEPGPIGTKLLAVKFMETCVLLFTPHDYEVPCAEGNNRSFDVSRLVHGHPNLNPDIMATEASRIVGLLLDILQSASTFRGALVVAVIKSLAAIAKNRPLFYDRISAALLSFDPYMENVKGIHLASIRYSLRTAFLGFLRCIHPSMVESRDNLLRAIRTLNPGEGTEQIIRQVEKMSRNMDRVTRDIRVVKDDIMSSEVTASGDLSRKRPAIKSSDNAIIDDFPTKRTRFDAAAISTQAAHTSDLQDDVDDVDDCFVDNNSSNASLMNNDLTPAEKMITMIGALLAEGKRGAESLELLISNIHADLLADIVIETMKHLPKGSGPLSTEHGNTTNFQSSPGVSSEMMPNASAPVSGLPSQFASTAADTSGLSVVTADLPILPSLPSDVKRDPRRDPRRLDPRRMVASSALNSVSLNMEDNADKQSALDHSSNKSIIFSETVEVENASLSISSKVDMQVSESSAVPAISLPILKESLDIREEPPKSEQCSDVHSPSNIGLSPRLYGDKAHVAFTSLDITADEGVDANVLDSDHYSPPATTTLITEDLCHDMPILPLHVTLTAEERMSLHKLAIMRIIDDYKRNHVNACLPLLARLVAQVDDVVDDILELLLRHIVLDYHHHEGHEIAMHVLYHLQTVISSDLPEKTSLFLASRYEKFLLSLAKALIDSLPASDKSFSKLLGEAPFLPDSVLRLLEKLCGSYSDHHVKETSEGDRVTQGLGAVWSLILGRPLIRPACLDIALKCAVHSQDEVRAKAIRLVANKLYVLSYASEKIEQFATSMLLSVVDQQHLEADNREAYFREQQPETGSQETTISSSQNSEPGASESESMKSSLVSPKLSVVSLSQAQRQASLFFALCTKKPSLLRLVFDIYGRAPKAVKQSVHRHIPILVRNLGSSYSELLKIISNPPEGCENLIILILQILTEESTPSTDLIVAVKHLYETKLKDAAILIPMLSSLSKDEVLPIFARLVDLPLEKFQAALARILQGSAHSGPALTPAEVLVAIHDINPEKDGVALKKITDACTACFEQRTVFTEQVLAKSLNHLVEKVPLPLLFMRTVIQAIDAFPTLVDFVMGILSKLVSKQVWKMPKLWVGFLKCAYQTQPHSFHALLQLPPPQLENALNRYSGLRVPLAAHVSQQNTRSSLPRQTLNLLGLIDEKQQASRPFGPTTLYTPDSSSSVHGATPT